MWDFFQVFFFATLLHFWVPPVAYAGALSGYTPYELECPTDSLLREGNSISNDEAQWLKSRQKRTTKALTKFIESKNLDVDVRSLFSNSSRPANIAVAVSGGGYRAMLVGAGELAALDGRLETDSPLAGVLDLASYLGGLSGGAWLVGLLSLQNWPLVQDIVLRNSPDIWNLTLSHSLVDTSRILSLGWDVLTLNYKSLMTHVRFWNEPAGQGIQNDIVTKQEAGFHTSITDVWGRGLAHQLLINAGNWLDSVTWSQITEIDAFANHEMPFPLVTALARSPQNYTQDLNSPVMEFNPYEMGSFDTSVRSFFRTKFLGSPVNNGKVVNGSKCINGFDNGAFVIGTSSSLFNDFLNTLVCEDCHQFSGFAKHVLKRLLEWLSHNKQDVALFSPNPFKGSKYGSQNLANNDTLFLTDGGLAGENVPLSTLMTTERKLDTVLAFDNNPALPHGASLTNVYRRQFTHEGRSIVAPYVPGENTFDALNLTARPTFFGCDARNQTDLAKDGVVPPLVVYLANRPFEYFSNTSLFKITYSDYEKKKMVQNGFDIASQLNGTIDDDWGACVGCAMIRRAEESLGVEQSDKCKKCFSRYCWDGTVVEEPYSRPLNFTLTGLTNDSMTLWGNQTYMPLQTLSSGFSNLFSKVIGFYSRPRQTGVMTR